VRIHWRLNMPLVDGIEAAIVLRELLPQLRLALYSGDTANVRTIWGCRYSTSPISTAQRSGYQRKRRDRSAVRLGVGSRRSRTSCRIRSQSSPLDTV
jgi:hypothetical protein